MFRTTVAGSLYSQVRTTVVILNNNIPFSEYVSPYLLMNVCEYCLCPFECRMCVTVILSESEGGSAWVGFFRCPCGYEELVPCKSSPMKIFGTINDGIEPLKSQTLNSVKPLVH